MYTVIVSPDRVVLRTTSKNSASALFRNLVKAVRAGANGLAGAGVFLHHNGALLTSYAGRSASRSAPVRR